MRGSERDRELESAFASSHLRGLPADVVDRLLVNARRVRIAAATTVHHEADERPHLYLVIDGLVRVYVAAGDGRTLTVRYCRPGTLLGVATLYAESFPPFGIQALSDSELLSFDPVAVRAFADIDPRLAGALLGETSERVMAFVGELSGQAFSTVTQRVARHLLDLAAESQQADRLVVQASQQQLAEAVGSVREVVVRILRDFREQRIVSTGRGAIVILDPERLLALGASVWNDGS